MAALAVPAGTAAAAPKVDVLVVGASKTLAGPKTVAAKRARAKVGAKRCRVGAGTPLAALLRMPVRIAVEDFSSCSGKPADADGLYVAAVDGEREKGLGGWVYKIGTKVSALGAGNVASKLHSGDRLLWFYCRTAGACQRTLSVRPAATTVAPGERLNVTVTAYDDNGHGVPAVGAKVTFGSASATAGPGGIAVLTAPSGAGRFGVVATQPKLVRSFPARVRVG